MKNIVHLTILSFLFTFLIFATNVFAASFTASVDPNTINAGTSDILLNFTLDNTDAVNISEVKITLHSSFVYSASPGTSVSDTLYSFSSDGVVTWSNTTSVGIVAAGTVEYFWFEVNSPSTTGSFNFNVSTLDVNNIFNSRSVSVTVEDQTIPQWSSNSTTPDSPVEYSPAQTYTFNITWTDNVAVSEVIFEWDGASNYTDTTSPAVVSLGSNKYGITLTDFIVSNYTYKWYASDTASLWNSTSVFMYDVTNAKNLINIYFNGNINQNFTIINGTTLNVTATSSCTQTGCSLILYKNDSSVTNPYIDVLPIGIYKFKANATGNANYTTNSTGATYYLTVIYPPPKYSISTSIPSSYSPTTLSIFNVTWTDDNDPNGFNVSLIEGDWSGSLVNYTMFRFPGTNVSSYNTTLLVGTFHWKVYANNSFNSFNSTPQNTITISKITPELELSIAPSWSVSEGTQTIVSCSSDEVSVSLYRNDTSVSNPNTQTLDDGIYIYKCNNTATANYGSTSKSKTLTVEYYAANLAFTQVESLILVEQNSSNSTIVQVKNTGEISQAVNFTVEDINSSWYSINSTDVTLTSGTTAAFLVDFSVGLVEIKDYSGNFKAYSPNKTITSNFTLRVLPSEANKTEINNTLAEYKAKMLDLEEEINQTKAREVNVSLAEDKLNQLKTKIEQAETHVSEEDYFSAYSILSEIKTLEAETRSELNKAKQELEKGRTNLMIYIIISVCTVVVVLIIIYLFWPVKLYKAERREAIWIKLKKKWKKIARRKKYKYKGS